MNQLTQLYIKAIDDQYKIAHSLLVYNTEFAKSFISNLLEPVDNFDNLYSGVKRKNRKQS